MARGIYRLTDRQIASKKAPGVYSDGGGLYLRVAPGGSKSWVFRYMVDGKPHNMGLGSINDTTLPKVRVEAQTYREAKRLGHDPIAQRRAMIAANKNTIAITVPTFAEIAEKYIAAREVEWTDRRLGGNWRAALKTHAAPLMKLPVDQIDEKAVLRILEPMWATRGPKLGMKVRGHIEAVLAAAKAAGHRSGDNPAAWRGHLEHAGLTASAEAKAVVGRKALPYEELPAFIASLRSADGVAASALEFLVLTAARAGEVVAGDRGPGMKWSEIEGNTWTIPAERMKGRVSHRVPLSGRAMVILKEMQALRTDDRVFAITNWTVRRQC